MAKGRAVPELTACYRTDRGMIRRNNQDRVYCSIGNRLSVFCIADGMGGHADGEFASSEAVRTVEEWTQAFPSASFTGEMIQIADDFETCIARANSRIYARRFKNGVCGTTIAALLIWENQYAAFSVGDSRVYRKIGFSFEQITRDDVWQNQPECAGLRGLSAKPEEHPDYGKLTKAVGSSEGVIPFRVTGMMNKKELFLLCSDGIYKACEEKTLKRMCTGYLFGNTEEKLSRRLNRICKKVIDRGAPDNYSAILVSIQ